MVRNIHPLQDALGIVEILHLIKKQNPDIIHTNSSKAGVLASIAGKLARKKVVFTAHGLFYFSDPRLWIRWLYTLTVWFASLFQDQIICVSEADRHQAVKHHLLSKNKVTTVYNDFSPPVFFTRSIARTNLGIPASNLAIGSVGNYYHRKGLDVLLEAIPKIKLLPQVNYYLVGEGPERVNLETKLDRYKLEHTVRLVGTKDQASKLLKAFDIFVLPSRFEGFPYALLEACQAGLPIVATDVGGNREAAGPGALYVPKEDPEALARAIQKLVDNPELRTELGHAGQAHVQQFTKQKMLTETARIYQQVLSEKLGSNI
jgi:glycosyltransferase involved in cell wall biosynthesis